MLTQTAIEDELPEDPEPADDEVPALTAADTGNGAADTDALTDRPPAG
jgi:hypothetical protein